MSFKPSPQQADFFNWIENSSGSCVLEAVAGAGKTTTLVEGLKLMKGSIFFGCFNKKISDEIKAKAPVKAGLTIGTMHSLGLGIWKKVNPKVTIDSNKCRNIYKNIFTEKEDYELQAPVLNLVSLAKQAGVGVLVPNDETSWYNLIDHYDVDCLDQDSTVVDHAKTVLSSSINQDATIIDFDDMIFSPLIHHVKPFQVDFCVIDECQDLNPTRLALALLIMKRDGRLVAVGDSRQSCYGFTGAMSDSIDKIVEATNATRLPLTVTYRCPKAVVNEARKYVSHITAHESAPEGSVVYFNGDLVNTAKSGDAILCRYNKPLVDLVYKFISNGVGARIEGREIGNNLKTLARRYKAKSFSVLYQRLDDYCDRESAKYRIKQKENVAISIEDKVACLKVIVNRVERINPRSASPVDDVCTEIDKLFGDEVKNCVVLSSIHKSKGLEFDRVFYLQSKENKFATQEWQQIQETNLKYIAITRSKKELFIVPVQTKEKEN